MMALVAAVKLSYQQKNESLELKIEVLERRLQNISNTVGDFTKKYNNPVTKAIWDAVDFYMNEDVPLLPGRAEGEEGDG